MHDLEINQVQPYEQQAGGQQNVGKVTLCSSLGTTASCSADWLAGFCFGPLGWSTSHQSQAGPISTHRGGSNAASPMQTEEGPNTETQ